MVLSSSQQVVVAFTLILFAFVVLPRMFGVGLMHGGSKDPNKAGFDPRHNRKGPGSVRGQSAVRGEKSISMNTAPGAKAQTLENMQQMKAMLEQEMKSDKYKPNSSKGYVFTLMPLYAVGVGVFAAYKFLKIKSADDSASQKNKAAKGAKKSEETESQLTELEQRLAQTEKMLNSILTQLDPLTNCVKSVAQEQKNEIMSQLQTIRYLMKKRGMECPPLNIEEPSCERNLDDLIESLAAHDTLPDDAPATETTNGKGEERAGNPGPMDANNSGNVTPTETNLLGNPNPMATHTIRAKAEEEYLLENAERDGEEEEEDDEEEEMDDSEMMPSLEGESSETDILIGRDENLGEDPPATGLRRRRPE